MKIHYKRVVIGLLLIGFCAITWLWMLGYLAPPPELAERSSDFFNSWSAPKILAVPALCSVVAGIGGFFVLLSSIKLAGDK